MRTPTGDYRVDFYNKYGERLPGEARPAESLAQAHRVAGCCPPAGAVSYSIMRCVFNSLDNGERWL